MTGFRHDIAGGQGNLITAALQSPNYVPGSAGWAVTRAGTAEFSSATVRGTVDASAITGGTITGTAITGGTVSGTAITGGTFTGTDFVINTDGAFFYSGSPALGNLVASITNVAGTDPYGNAYSIGFAIYAAGGQSVNMSWYDHTGQTIPSIALTPELKTITGSYTVPFIEAGTGNLGAADEYMCAFFSSGTPAGSSTVTGMTEIGMCSESKDGTLPANGALSVGANDLIIWYDTPTGGAVEILGPLVATSGSAATPTIIETDTWHPITLDTGWSTLSSYAVPQYRLLPDGNIQLAGLASFGSSQTSNHNLNSANPLPPAYRPKSAKVFRDGNQLGQRATVQINSSGVIEALGTSAYPYEYAEIDAIVSLL